MASTNPARGTRDFLPAEIRKREYVINIIKDTYGSYGFEPLETPAFENLETLTGKYGEEGGQLMFKILKRGEKLGSDLELIREPNLFTEYKETALEARMLGQSVEERTRQRGKISLADLALRYDLTVPLARVIANNRNELPKFFKRYQIQPVWRADRPAKGRFREFYQCDVDWIGSSSPIVEAELISAAADVFERLGFKGHVFRINDRRRLGEMADAAGIASGLRAEAMVSLDKLDKIGGDAVVNELIERGVDRVNAVEFMRLAGDPALAPKSDRLEEIKRLLPPEIPIKDDPSLARGLSYYTGTIIEVNVPDLAGSLAGGGRYDELIGMFGKDQIPACGISLGLERILVVMDERKMFPPEIANSAAADVLVTVWSAETADASLALAADLRSKGIRASLYPEPDKLGKQLKYADSLGVAFTCVLGESEIADGTVLVKNMRTGEQQNVARDKAFSLIEKK